VTGDVVPQCLLRLRRKRHSQRRTLGTTFPSGVPSHRRAAHMYPTSFLRCPGAGAGPYHPGHRLRVAPRSGAPTRLLTGPHTHRPDTSPAILGRGPVTGGAAPLAVAPPPPSAPQRPRGGPRVTHPPQSHHVQTFSISGVRGLKRRSSGNLQSSAINQSPGLPSLFPPSVRFPLLVLNPSGSVPCFQCGIWRSIGGAPTMPPFPLFVVFQWSGVSIYQIPQQSQFLLLQLTQPGIFFSTSAPNAKFPHTNRRLPTFSGSTLRESLSAPQNSRPGPSRARL